MISRLSKGASGNSQKKNIVNAIAKSFSFMLLAVIGVGLMLGGYGCSGSTVPEGVSSEVVTGVAAIGDTLAGEVSIRDSENNERRTVLGNDGSFALDVTGMTGPFVLRAIGSSRGTEHTLYSFAEGRGIANINPFSHAIVANAADVDDPSEVYDNPGHDKLRKVKDRLPESIRELQSKLKRLLRNYDADDDDPVRGHYRADHTRLDGVFDDIKVSLRRGILTITNAETGALIFSGKVKDFLSGHFNDDDDCLPTPGTVPVAPAGLSAAAGANKITLSWNSVGNATSYNIYWSRTSGVTKSNGTKISPAANPYIHTGLTAGTTYYYVATAVNNAGESAASDEISATVDSTPIPTPTVPAAPAGVTAAGGTRQVTVSFAAVPDATSYNLYWSTTSGVTKANGTRITGVTSPVVHTGRLESTTYYYIVTAVNNVGESEASVQIAATTLAPVPVPTVPLAPNGVTATGANRQVTISWSPVSGASSYNLYYATASGVTVSTGTRIAGATSPYVQTGLSEGTTYYYIVTAVNSVGQSAPSSQISATTNAPLPTVPSIPSGVTAAGGAKQVTISWAAASGATSYNIYWSRTAGVTTLNGTKITSATRPYIQTGLLDGATYYYIVTAVNSAGESAGSSQVSAVTNAPLPTVPSAPGGVTAVGGAKQVTLSWSATSGANSYNVYWSTMAGVTKSSGTRIAGVASPYIHTGRLDSTSYYYVVTALNGAGESADSVSVTATTSAPALDGAALYAASCQRCHGPITNHDLPNGMTVQSIKNASMAFGRTDAELQAIVNAMP